MYSARGVSMTDGKNRKNHVIPLKAMLSAYSEHWNIPMIMNLGHDRSKPIGYTVLDGVYMEPGKAYLINSSNFPDNPEENNQLYKLVNALDTKNFYTERKSEIDRLYSYLGENATIDAKVVPTGQAVAIIDKGIVSRVFPEIMEMMQDGLINLKELIPIYKGNDSLDEKNLKLVPGVYQKGRFLLFAHQYFRRNMCIANTINDAFFETFENLRARDDLEIKVAIDVNIIGLAGTESLEAEYQYWWGPKFNNDLASIPEGVTCYRNERYDNLLSNIIDTQFYWHTQDTISTFECEEICDKENVIIDNIHYFGCRYIHSMVNQSTEMPYHLDGAIRLYTDEQILKRMDSGTDISKYGKDSLYTKLWRIDSDLDVSTWKELITHYFRDNQLIGEYFGGTDEVFEQIKKEEPTHNQIGTGNKYIPVELNSGSGIRIYLRYCKAKDIPDGRDAVIDNSLMITTIEGKTQKILEADTVTLLKLLLEKDMKIEKPISALVDFGDMIFNYPCIFCSNVDVAEKVLKSILQLCKAWKLRSDNRLLSFSIQINREKDDSVKLSFAGHINDFVEVLEKCLPNSQIIIEDWVLQLYEKNNQFGTVNGYPDKFLLLHNNELRFERIFVSPEQIREVRKENGVYSVELLLPNEDVNYVQDNKVIVAPAYLIKESRCKKCGKEYQRCGCIKFIEDDVSEEIIKMDYLGMIWTNRSAF